MPSVLLLRQSWIRVIESAYDATRTQTSTELDS